ncbi:hypothetical protein TNCV_2267751 [Trichonephila clavipes]|nr:hypothetical protein TNCV_2267751 [Trichonephila clavipes]
MGENYRPLIRRTFLSRNRSSYTAEQFHRDASQEVVDRRAPNNSKKWQWMTEGDVSVQPSTPAPHGVPHMQLLPWPAYSPDVSPIEPEWDWVGLRLTRDPRPVASKE